MHKERSSETKTTKQPHLPIFALTFSSAYTQKTTPSSSLFNLITFSIFFSTNFLIYCFSSLVYSFWSRYIVNLADITCRLTFFCVYGNFTAIGTYILQDLHQNVSCKGSEWHKKLSKQEKVVIWWKCRTKAHSLPSRTNWFHLFGVHYCSLH